MAPQPSSKKTRTPNWRVLTRFGLIGIAVSMTLATAIYASQRFEKFMIRDPRFFLPGPPDYGMESPNLEAVGIKYASRSRILQVFDQDYGRSVYLLPLAARRKRLMDIDWVHDAAVARIWPNRVFVQVTERTPAAFIKLPATNIARWALIDEEGMILDPPAKAQFQLPVLSGVSVNESPDKRGMRVRRMQRMMKDLGPMAAKVSEVDVKDLDNLKINEEVQGRMLSLVLGDRNFSSRLRHFLDHFTEIHRKMPQAASFDLRLDDRITALEEGDGR